MRKMALNVTQEVDGSFTAQVVLDDEQIFESHDKDFQLAYSAAAQYVTAPDSVIPWSK